MTREVTEDFALPFQLDGPDMRGRLVRLGGVLDQILTRHAYPLAVSALVAECVLLATMIGHAMKLRGQFSVQVRSDGPVSLITADYHRPDDAAPRLRALARFDAARLDPTLTGLALLGSGGIMALTIDQGPPMRPYQGLVPLAGKSLAESAALYFAQSEQIATRFQIAVAQSTEKQGTVWRGGGLMVQHLPKASPGVVEAPDHGMMTADALLAETDAEDDWRRIGLLLDTIETSELIGPHPTPDRLLLRLFHEDQPRVWPADPVTFGCTCNAGRVAAVLRQYTPEMLSDMATEDGRIHADCQFCNARYSFDPVDLHGGHD